MHRLWGWLADAVLPCRWLAGLLALVAPSEAAAANTDLLLAVLVLFTALGERRGADRGG
jgi:uncharacterized protein YhhL (DUF1145 family)